MNINNHTQKWISIAEKLLEKECIDECLDVCNEIESLINESKKEGISLSDEEKISHKLANVKRGLNLLMLPVVRKKSSKNN